MAFHVFVEGATDATPGGVARLADAIAKHYGLPAADLLARLQKGRFRVKGNTDRATAEQYCRDLQILGARCVIEEANADNSQRSTPLPFPAVRPATPVAGSPVLARAPTELARPTAPAPVSESLLARAATELVRPSTPAAGTPAAAPSRPSTPAAGAPAARPSAPQYQSGLSAAFSNETPAASLGALEQDGAAFSLSSVDGADQQAPSASAFGPPESMQSASIGPAPEKPKPAKDKPKAERPKDVPLDLFAPPDAQGDELVVAIASDEVDHSARKRASTPPPTGEPRSSSQPLPKRGSQPSIDAGQEIAVRPSRLGPLGDSRTRFAAGVLLAILIGLLPAHLVAASREESAFKEIDTKVMAAQQLADSPDAYATLDRMRADQLDRKEGAKRNAALIAFAIWALVGGAVAFVWFKKIPWDNYE